MLTYIPVEGIFCVGNGQVAAYLQNADILQVFGPYYSTPSALSMRLQGPPITSQNQRIGGSGNYVTNLQKGIDTIGKITSFTHPTLPIFIRVFDLVAPITYALQSDFPLQDTPCGSNRLIEIPQGWQIFAKCKTVEDIFCQVVCLGDCSWEGNTVTFPAGRSVCCFVAGSDSAMGLAGYLKSCAYADMVQRMDMGEILDLSMDWWRDTLSQITLTPPPVPQGEELVESVAVALISQTAKEGGTLAGMFYHLAYGRDMYGVFRGFLALGLYTYARTMITYLADIYTRRGYMPNASGMGGYCAHCHENDDVEQTGYYLLELVAYVQATKDVAFLKAHLSYGCGMLEAQERHLAGGMLPFNGDETYIAGGIFPRSGIDHGSMEATSLYIGSSLAFLDLVEAHGLLDEAYIATHRQKATEATHLFAQNFTSGETVYINQPARLAVASMPNHRHGVCHGCNQMTYLHRTPQNGFLCTHCFGSVEASATTTQYTTDCALWMTVFAGCSQLPPALITSALERSMTQAVESGFGKQEAQNMVGYQYGVLLYAMAEYGMTHHPRAKDLLNALLSQRMTGSVWVEYYQSGQPSLHSCPYRPWESAINLLGIITFDRERNS